MRDDPIVVARGRNYGDVAPVDGVVSGSGKQCLDVDVTLDIEMRDLGLVS